MKYSIADKQSFCRVIDELCGILHDGPYISFSYDKTKQKANITIKCYLNNTSYSMCFSNIKMLFSTNFSVWGINDENLVGIETIESSYVYRSMVNLDAIKNITSKEDILNTKKDFL